MQLGGLRLQFPPGMNGAAVVQVARLLQLQVACAADGAAVVDALPVGMDGYAICAGVAAVTT